jgi:hypothetical protein
MAPEKSRREIDAEFRFLFFLRLHLDRNDIHPSLLNIVIRVSHISTSTTLKMIRATVVLAFLASALGKRNFMQCLEPCIDKCFLYSK